MKVPGPPDIRVGLPLKAAGVFYSGEYALGSRIPSEPQLARAYGIGRPTVRQTIDVLVRKHLLSRRRGSGTYLSSPERELDLFSLAGISSAESKRPKLHSSSLELG